jgi:hypothetical protein
LIIKVDWRVTFLDFIKEHKQTLTQKALRSHAS